MFMVYLTGRAANVTYAVFHRVYRTGRGGILGSSSLSGMADTQGVSNIRKGRPYVHPLPPCKIWRVSIVYRTLFAHKRYGRHTGMSEAEEPIQMKGGLG